MGAEKELVKWTNQPTSKERKRAISMVLNIKLIKVEILAQSRTDPKPKKDAGMCSTVGMKKGIQSRNVLELRDTKMFWKLEFILYGFQIIF